MAINIKNIEELLQKKAYAVDSATPVSDLADMVEATLLLTNSLVQYDSAGALPTASSTNVKIAFISSDKSIRFNMGGRWDSLTSGGSRAAPVPPSQFSIAHGVAYGYSAGGEPSPTQPFPLGGNVTIEKFSFVSDGNATDVGDLAEGHYGAGRHDPTLALILGGGIYPGNVMTNKVQSFTFASGTDAAVTPYVLGNQANYSARGIHQTPDIAFVTGGYKTPSIVVYSTVNKYPFANNSNATTITDPSNNMQNAFYASASMSPTTAYFAGGWEVFSPTPTALEVLRKYPFATEDAASTDIGDLLAGTTYGGTGLTGPTHGYHAASAAGSNVIQKYSFASDGDAVDAGDMQVSAPKVGGNNSPTYGYITTNNHPTINDAIEKFPWSSDAPTVDVGDLTTDHFFGADMQV